MYQPKIYLLLLTLAFINRSYAQEKRPTAATRVTICGTIKSRINGETVIGASIKAAAIGSSFLVTRRITYADVFLKLSNDSSINSNTLYFYDLNAKLNYILDDKNRLYLSGYFGQDKMGVGLILRPPRLMDSKHTGKYRTAINEHLGHLSKIARADLADYIVNHLTDEKVFKAKIEISY